jgi:hypothetical protein
MDSRVCVAFKGPVARIPTPPAFDTAATNSGVEIQLIPGSTSGYLHLRSAVMRVLIAGAPSIVFVLFFW